MFDTYAQHEVDAADEVALVRSAKEGNIEAFEQLIARHTTMIFRVAANIVGSREDAEDVVQEAFLKAFQHLRQFEERARFSTWLTRIAVNAALMKLRVARRTPLLSMDAESEEHTSLGKMIADWKPNPEQLYNRKQLKEILQQALAALPEGYRMVFLLRDVEGVSIADTAELLGLSVTNVKTRLGRARQKLRVQLDQYFNAFVASTGTTHGFPQVIAGPLPSQAG